MIGICDKEPVGLFVGDYFARKRQRQIADLGFLEYQFKRRFIQFSALAKLGDRVADCFVEHFITALAR